MPPDVTRVQDSEPTRGTRPVRTTIQKWLITVPVMVIRLRPGTTVDVAIQTLEMLAVNAYGAAMPPGPNDPVTLRDNYVRWSQSCEGQLITIMERPDARSVFENPGHRDLCSMAPGTQIQMLITNEVSAKSAELIQMAFELRKAREVMQKAPGYPTLVDTNLLLQCLRPDQIKWTTVVGSPTRLMIPSQSIRRTRCQEDRYERTAAGHSERNTSMARKPVP